MSTRNRHWFPLALQSSRTIKLYCHSCETYRSCSVRQLLQRTPGAKIRTGGCPSPTGPDREGGNHKITRATRFILAAAIPRLGFRCPKSRVRRQVCDLAADARAGHDCPSSVGTSSVHGLTDEYALGHRAWPFAPDATSRTQALLSSRRSYWKPQRSGRWHDGLRTRAHFT